jgi:hypothetical protein
MRHSGEAATFSSVAQHKPLSEGRPLLHQGLFLIFAVVWVCASSTAFYLKHAQLLGDLDGAYPRRSESRLKPVPSRRRLSTTRATNDQPVPDAAGSGGPNAIISPSRWYKKAVRPSPLLVISGHSFVRTRLNDVGFRTYKKGTANLTVNRSNPCDTFRPTIVPCATLPTVSFSLERNTCL